MNKYNTLPRRVVARIMDASVLLMFFGIIVSLFDMSRDTEKLVLALIYPLYYIVFLTIQGQTLGMYMMGTKLVLAESETQHPDAVRIIIREMLGVYLVLLSMLFLERFAQGQGDKLRLFIYTQTSWVILHFLIVAMSKHHRTIHDFLAQTVVVKVMPLGGKKKVSKYATV